MKMRAFLWAFLLSGGVPAGSPRPDLEMDGSVTMRPTVSASMSPPKTSLPVLYHRRECFRGRPILAGRVRA